MPTNNPRINITFEPDVISILNHLAKREHKTLACLAKELILEALERRKDHVLSSIATHRDTGKEKRIKHDNAFG